MGFLKFATMSADKKSASKSAQLEDGNLEGDEPQTPDASKQERVTASKLPVGKKTIEKNPKNGKVTKPKTGSKKGTSQPSKIDKGDQSQASIPKGELSQYMSTLQEENERMMKSMMDKMFDQMKARLSDSQSASTSYKDVDSDSVKSGQDADGLSLYPSRSDIEQFRDGGSDASKKTSEDEKSSAGNSSLAPSVMGDDIQWSSIIKQLPSYYPGTLHLEEDEEDKHTSFIAKSLQGPKRVASIPKLPLEGEMKKTWDEIEKSAKNAKSLPACSAKNARRFRIKTEDFEKYGVVPSVDQEYKARLELDAKRGKPFGNKTEKSSPVIKDSRLRMDEIDFHKCDESARFIVRASSHASLMLNAINTIISDPQKYQQTEAMNLVQGVNDSLKAMADGAIRITARAVMARRRICLSQLAFKDSNARQEMMTLPMDGKYLFHGEMSRVMHKHAEFARDVRETSDYVSTKQNTNRGKRQSSQEDSSAPPNKKRATNVTQGNPQAQGQQGGKFNFKKPTAAKQQDRNFPSSQPKFQSKNQGSRWGNKNQRY